MEKVPLWKPLIIILVVVGCALMIIPPSATLKPGLDLAGGTVLVYQVDVPPNSDSQREIDDTIVVLQQRVDPTGVRSLIWRQLAGHRIEIQMPIASKESEQRRTEYLKANSELIQNNLSNSAVDADLRLPAARDTELAKLAGGNRDLAAALHAVAVAQDKLDKVNGPQQKAQDAFNQAQASLNALPPATTQPDKKRSVLEAKVKALQDDLTQTTLAYLHVKTQVDAARAEVDKYSVDPALLERALALPVVAEATTDKTAPPTKTRKVAIDDLIKAHPARAEQIKKVAAAYDAYESVKGTLDDPNDLIELLRSSGVLEFRIGVSPTSPDVAQFRERLATRGPRSAGERYVWTPIDDEPTSFAPTAARMKALKADPAAYFGSMGLVAQSYGNKIYLLLGNGRDDSLTHDQDTWQLSGAYQGGDDMGFPAVDFELDPAGGNLMGRLTGSHINSAMAIVLDGKVMSAPNIKSQISSRGMINGGQGGFQPKELDYLIRTLKAGSLKARLSENPISIQKVGSEFGQDNLHKSMLAAEVTLVVICLFMAGYYFVGGFIADLALLSNVIIILGLMAATDSVFTLPGIAGVILTLGMAVDANVLVFERIREELERKNPVRTAIRLGYSKAMATIIDTHLTTLLTCAILYYVGTADVKGFALTLGIGLAASFFTAVFASHVWLEIWVQVTHAKTLGMLPLKFPAIHRFFTPSIDWYGKRYLFVGISLVLTIGGMIGIAMRGRDFLDIEFRSGTEVAFKIGADKQPLSLSDVRDKLTAESKALMEKHTAQAQALAAQVAAAPVGSPERQALQDKLQQAKEFATEASYLAGDRATVATVGDTNGTTARAFDIATLATDTKFVTDAIKNAFRDVLSTQRPVDFAGAKTAETDAGSGGAGPDLTAILRPPLVYPIRKPILGDDIGRPDVTTPVPEFIGGVVIYLKDLNPALTISELRDRIETARLQSGQENMGYHPYDLIPLDAATGAETQPGNSATGPGAPGPVPGSSDGAATSGAPGAQGTGRQAATPGGGTSTETRYSSIAVVARDDLFNYVQNPDTIAQPHGLADSEWQLVHSALRRDISLDSVSNFSSQISSTIQQQAILAVVGGWLVMLVYLWFRFGNLRFGIGAVLALIHDVITAIGLAALAFYVYATPVGQFLLLQPFRVNLSLVAAALTLIGYSVNDTIVVFDRIRENRGKLTVLTPGLINDSINQTISRTVLTAGTVLIACFCLYVLGGEAVRGFAFVMLVGSLVGCYSSIAVASPLLLVWRREPVAKPAGGRGGTPARWRNEWRKARRHGGTKGLRD